MQNETTQLSAENQNPVITAIREKIESLKSQAEAIVGDYWAFAEESNEALRLEKKIGNRIKEKPICFGQMGERVKPSTNKEYKLSTLLRYSTGTDDTKIVSTELKLMSIREELEMYHEMLVSLDRRARRIERITKKYGSQSNESN
jgi:hypothetical protein